MVKYQFEVNDLRLDHVCRNYQNQHLEGSFHMERGIRQGICYWFLAAASSSDPFWVTSFVFVSPQIILSYRMSWSYLSSHPNQSKTSKQILLPCLIQSHKHFFFSGFLIFILIDFFFMEAKLSNGKFLHSTREYHIMNSLTVGFIIWWN